MNQAHLPPIPPSPTPTEADLAKRASIKSQFFSDNILPDDNTLAAMLESISPTTQADILDTLPSLLPPGPVTPVIATLLSDSVMGIYHRFKGTKQSSLRPEEIAAFIRKMPCQKAGHAFLYVYKYWFEEMVSERSLFGDYYACLHPPPAAERFYRTPVFRKGDWPAFSRSYDAPWRQD
jgi:hypothetical protein